MSEPFIAEIRIFPSMGVPTGWFPCEGQTLPIVQYTALFSLIGNTFGGNGSSTFQLPDLRGRAVMGVGNGPGLTPRSWGETLGTDTVTLSVDEIPSHHHSGSVSTRNSGRGQSPNAQDHYIGPSTGGLPYANLNGTPSQFMNVNAVGPTGFNMPHDNQQPFLCLTFAIAYQGIFPPRP